MTPIYHIGKIYSGGTRDSIFGAQLLLATAPFPACPERISRTGDRIWQWLVALELSDRHPVGMIDDGQESALGVGQTDDRN